MHDEVNAENKKLWNDNRDIKAEFNNAKSQAEQLAREVQILRPQMEDIVPENEKLQRYADELKRKLNEVQEQNRRLTREPQHMKEQ
jgi:hypothetical protein